jgi:hypothetical protein
LKRWLKSRYSQTAISPYYFQSAKEAAVDGEKKKIFLSSGFLAGFIISGRQCFLFWNPDKFATNAMAVAKYRSRDIVPVFIHVLDMCAYFYAEIALKIAVVDHYQQLKGNTATTHINESILIRIASAVNNITVTLEKTAEIYVYNLEHYLQSDKRILNLSEDFYWSLICNPFPGQINEHDFDQLDYIEMLELHARSLINVFEGFLEIFHFGEVDTDNLYKGNAQEKFCLSRNCDPKNIRALAELKILYEQLHSHQAEMYRYSMILKLKQNEDDNI